MLENRDTNGFITIKNIVASYMLNNKPRNVDRMIVKDNAIRGFMYLNIFSVVSVKTVRVYPNSVNAFSYPSDMIENGVFKLYFDIHGEKHPLVPNDNMVTYLQERCGEDYKNMNVNNSWRHHHYKNTYGIDTTRHLIIIDGHLPLEYKLYLDYTTSGVSVTSTTLVPIYMQECLLAWIDWKLNPSNQALEQLFGRLCTEVENYSRRVTKDEFVNAVNRSLLLEWGRHNHERR